MLNKYGRKILAGVGAVMTVLGSNSLSGAVQTKEKAIQNAAKIAENVNRNSGGYSRNGALFSLRTFLETLAFGGLLGYGYNRRKGYLTSLDNLKKETKKKLSEDNNLLKIQKLESEIEELKVDRKTSAHIFEFLKTFVSVSNEYHISNLKNWSSWSSFEAKYDFVPYVTKVEHYGFPDELDDVFYQVLGVFDFTGGDKSKSLRPMFPINKEKLDFSLSEKEIEEISKSKTLNEYSLALLDEVRLVSNFWNNGNIFDINSGLREFNGGVGVKFGENCKRVFSKVYFVKEGCYLCEGFIMEHGDCHDKGLVLRFTYGNMVEKKVEKK